MEQIFDKVYDNVMSKLYKKIFPLRINDKDEILYSKVQSLSRIEPNNIMKDLSNYNCDLVLPDITRYFNYINIGKSPKKK